MSKKYINCIKSIHIFIPILTSFLMIGCSGGVINPSDQVSSIGLNSNNHVQERITQRANVYRLGPGDKLNVVVDGVKDHSGEFDVSGNGQVSVPFVGQVKAAGHTLKEFEEQLKTKLKEYIRNPQVRVSVLNYRPFYIQGEIKKGGQYDYMDGLDVRRAVAIAGGYTYRAIRGYVYIQRANDIKEKKYDLSHSVYVQPGDNIRIPERIF